MNSPEEKHKQFLLGLKEGYTWQLWIGYQLLKEGFFVQVPSLRLRPSLADKNIYTDEGDISIYTGDRILKFECKSVKLEFTSKDDFPGDEMIVDMVSNWGKKEHKPLAIINICTKTEGKFVIFTAWKSQESWIKRTTYDSKKKYYREFYWIDKGSRYVHSWESFVGWLKSLEKT